MNEWLYAQGAFTHFKDYGDERIFSEFSPNCAVWRFVKGRRSRKMDDGRVFRCVNGLLYFGGGDGNRLGDYFDVKVGAVSGADDVFTHKNGNKAFVCSHTRRTGQCRKMIYNENRPELKHHRKRLLARKIRKFSEENWWEWGRGYPERDDDRIYVNQKTRQESPFFTHEAKSFDGSVLALFPRLPMVLEKMRDVLNQADWDELGFVTGGRFIFSQRSLEKCNFTGYVLMAIPPVLKEIESFLNGLEESVLFLVITLVKIQRFPKMALFRLYKMKENG